MSPMSMRKVALWPLHPQCRWRPTAEQCRCARHAPAAHVEQLLVLLPAQQQGARNEQPSPTTVGNRDNLLSPSKQAAAACAAAGNAARWIARACAPLPVSQRCVPCTQHSSPDEPSTFLNTEPTTTELKQTLRSGAAACHMCSRGTAQPACNHNALRCVLLTPAVGAAVGSQVQARYHTREHGDESLIESV
jgi:hypothetical protein